jgi:hypothetical protein
MALTELCLSFLYTLTKPECRVILNKGSINKQRQAHLMLPTPSW